MSQKNKTKTFSTKTNPRVSKWIVFDANQFFENQKILHFQIKHNIIAEKKSSKIKQIIVKHSFNLLLS